MKRYTLEEWERRLAKASEVNTDFIAGDPYSRKKKLKSKKK